MTFYCTSPCDNLLPQTGMIAGTEVAYDKLCSTCIGTEVADDKLLYMIGGCYSGD